MAAGLLAWGHPVAADVSPETCGDADSDLGTDCSLRELDGSRVIIDNVEFYNITVPLGDRDTGYPISENVRIVAVGEGTSRPGIRFEVENGALNHDPCVDDQSIGLTNIGYFVRANNAQLQDIEVNHVTLSGEGFAVTDIGEYEFGLEENFSGEFAHSSQDPLPFSLEVDNLNLIAVGVGAAARSPGAFNLPDPERCGTKAGIAWFEQRVEVNNVPPLPPGITESQDISCSVIDSEGIICPDTTVTPDPGCPADTAGLDVVDIVGVSVAELSTCAEGGDGTSLEMPIDTPLSSFEIWFDFRFEASARLDVFIDDTLIDTVEGEPDSTFIRREILVNDPDLMGLEGAVLRFVLAPAASPGPVLAAERQLPAAAEDDPVVEIANVLSPRFLIEELSVEINGDATIFGQGADHAVIEPGCGSLPGLQITCLRFRNQCAVSIGTEVECTNPDPLPGSQFPNPDGSNPGFLLGTGLFLGDQTSLLESPFGETSRSTSLADSRALVQYQGAGVGSYVQIDNDLAAKAASANADGEDRVTGKTCNEARIRYQASSTTVPDGTLFPIDYKLRINGTVTFILNEPLEPNTYVSPAINYDVRGGITINRATRDDVVDTCDARNRGVEEDAVFRGVAEFFLDSEEPFSSATGIGNNGFLLENNCPPGDDPNDPAPGTAPLQPAQIVETFEDGKLREAVLSVDQAFCFPQSLYASVGDDISIELIAELGVTSLFGNFDGLVIADFSKTAFASISTPVEGIEFVSAELEELVGSEFEINAGLNDVWFDSTTPGQGFLITVLPNVGQVFLAWFTFDTERPDENMAMLGESGHRWLTAQGPYDGNTANLAVYLTEGGVFDAAEPPAVTDVNDPVGTITIVWDDCENGTLSYDIDPPGVQGEIPISRIVPDNVALCETLASQ